MTFVYVQSNYYPFPWRARGGKWPTAKPGGFVTCEKAGCKKIMCATVRAAKRHFERHGTASDSPLLRWVQGKIGDINDEAKNNIAARIQAQIEERRAGR